MLVEHLDRLSAVEAQLLQLFRTASSAHQVVILTIAKAASLPAVGQTPTNVLPFHRQRPAIKGL